MTLPPEAIGHLMAAEALLALGPEAGWLAEQHLSDARASIIEARNEQGNGPIIVNEQKEAAHELR